jgi:hypothetical protein
MNHSSKPPQAARLVRAKMWDELNQLPYTNDFSQALTELYYRLDRKMKMANDKYANQGCTAITVLLKGKQRIERRYIEYKSGMYGDHRAVPTG